MRQKSNSILASSGSDPIAIRRIRRRIPNVAIIVASLGLNVSVEDDKASPAGAESVEDTLRATIDKVMAVASTLTDEKASTDCVALTGCWINETLSCASRVNRLCISKIQSARNVGIGWDFFLKSPMW